MDAAAQLALMAKAKLVFETPGTFLSFPVLSPLSFHPGDLDFSRALADPAAGVALQDFSRAVNRCPGDPVCGADGDEYLWDHYDAWLTAMTLANSQLDPDDQAAYAAARTFLVVSDSNGFDTDSPAVVAYKQCRDAAIAAQQAYNSAELTATCAGNAAALSTWQSTDGPPLRDAITVANTAWTITGRKADVEAAQGTLIRCEAQMPQTVWAQWRKLYTPDIDCITDPVSNASYVPSGFAPADLAGQPWTTLHMVGPEILALAAGAPAALRSLFGDVGNSSISSISFEFSSASVVRPWFSAAVFQSRFWKFNDGTQLSDGASPPNGAWPAFISAVVFARNVQVTYANPAHGNMPVSEPLHFTVAAHPPLIVNPALHVLPRPMLLQQSFAGELPRTPFGPRPMMTLPFAPHMASAAPIVPVHPVEPVAATPAQTAPQLAVHPILRLGTSAYTAAAPATPPAPAPAGGASQTSLAASAPDDRIVVLAFICRTLPKSPNPDLGLTWTGGSTAVG